MCNMLVRLLACVVFAGAGIYAYPTLKDGVKIKEGSDSNKTNTTTDQRAASHSADKSAGPILVPVYQQFLPSPMNMPPPVRFQRVIVPPQIPAYPIRNPAFVNRQPVRLPSSYSAGYQTHPQVSIPQQEVFVQPMTPPSNSFPPQQIYQQPAVMPPSYNFAPYASNSYAMYTSRSVVDDEQKFASLALGEQPQYSSAGGYILNPQRIEYRVEQPPSSTMYVNDYSSIPNLEYSSEGMEPRHVKISSVDSSHEDLSHISFVEPSDQVFYEVIDPSLASQLEQQPHLHNMNFRVIGEQQPARHSVAKPYVNLESMNWMWSRGDYPAVYM